MTEPLLSVRGLTLERGGRQLLENFKLQVSAGELVLVEGENGSGKTSLLRALAGLARYGHTGEIQRTAEPPLYIGHKPGLKTLLSPRENLAWYCHSQGQPSDGIVAALESVGLAGFEDLLCQSLSAGQQRRVNLARLFLSRQRLWLLDEPFTAIDRQGIAALVATLVRHVQGGGAVVMTSHQALVTEYPVTRIALGGVA